MKKKLLMLILLTIILSGCSNQNQTLNQENIKPNVGTIEYADRQLNKAYTSLSNPNSTSSATEASATYLKLILEEEKKQTDLLQQINNRNNMIN